MIKSYSIKNFKSIKNSETISFLAHNYKETDLSPLKNNLLPLIGLFGPNGGGKSAIFESMNVLINLFKINNDNITLNTFFNGLNNYLYNKENEIEWILELVADNGNTYKYILRIKNKEIIYEKLSLTNKDNNFIIFEKKINENIIFHKSFNNLQLNNIQNGLLVSFLNTNIQNDYIKEFCVLFNNIFVILNLFISPNISPAPFFPPIQLNFDINILDDNKETFLQIFKELDLNIIDFKIITDSISNQKHLILTKQNNIGTFELNFLFESEGTKKIIQLLTYIVLAIHNGHTIFIDEIDTSLHTKLLGYILTLFHNKNNKKAQLLFSSHDINTLDSKYLRKDEVYFLALNESYFTNVVCLSQFGSLIRKKTSYAKKYLDSQFGYDPYISKAYSWLKDEKK